MNFVRYGSRVIDLDSIVHAKIDSDGMMIIFGDHGLLGAVDPEYVEDMLKALDCKPLSEVAHERKPGGGVDESR